jgi:hypothetical protein
MFVFGLLLNILCERGLGIISWILVFVPFMLMSTITALLLFVFGLNPTTGKLNKLPNKNSNKHHNKHHHNKHHHNKHHHNKHHNKHHETQSESSESESSESESSDHNSKLCKKMGCILSDKTADGNCEELYDSTGKCYRQCYYGCDPKKGSCKYDTDCHLCPSNKIPCVPKKTPSKSGSTSVETFLTNMKQTTRF